MCKKVVGYHLAVKIDINELLEKFTLQVVNQNNSEVLFETENNGLLSVFNYGSIVFMDVDEAEQMKLINILRELLNIESRELRKETFEIEEKTEEEISVFFDRLVVDKLNRRVAEVIMLNIAQSVALDFYSTEAEKLLEETKLYASELERTGKFRLRGRKLLKYTGRVLNIRNRIAENLNIFKSPEIVWEDQKLTAVNSGMNRALEIGVRYSGVTENLNIIKENLELFRDVNQHSHSSVLEWIVIILILIEVVHLLIEWIF